MDNQSVLHFPVQSLPYVLELAYILACINAQCRLPFFVCDGAAGPKTYSFSWLDATKFCNNPSFYSNKHVCSQIYTIVKSFIVAQKRIYNVLRRQCNGSSIKLWIANGFLGHRAIKSSDIRSERRRSSSLMEMSSFENVKLVTAIQRHHPNNHSENKSLKYFWAVVWPAARNAVLSFKISCSRHLMSLPDFLLVLLLVLCNWRPFAILW